MKTSVSNIVTTLHKAEANIVPLSKGSTDPLVEWERWKKTRQSKSELQSIQWEEATGLAIINGPGGWHCITLDGCTDSAFVERLLDRLGLPLDYEWVVKSSRGFHIWFRSTETLDETVLELECSDSRCDRLELRWAGCYTPVPVPDDHPGQEYHFHNTSPGGPPAQLSAQKISDAADHIARSNESTGFPSPVRATEVNLAKISWLWDEYIAEGMVHLLDGDPGTGKSTFLLGLAASFSNGQTPDGKSVPPMTTLYVSGEDPADTVLVPRFHAADGNPDRLRIYDAAMSSGMTFPDALPAVKATIEECNARLCVIDPFFSLLDRELSKNVEQDVRVVLSSVNKVAEETGCSFFLVRHFNKKEDSSALYRGGGSIGITAQARLAYAFLPHPENDDERVLAWEKNNISRKDQTESLVFRMNGVQTDGVGEQPVLELDRTEPVTAQEILDGKSRGRPPTKRNRAKALIKDKLRSGRRFSAREMYNMYVGEDLSKATVRRARIELGVKVEREGGTTFWSLPEEKQDFSLSPSE